MRWLGVPLSVPHQSATYPQPLSQADASDEGGAVSRSNALDTKRHPWQPLCSRPRSAEATRTPPQQHQLKKQQGGEEALPYNPRRKPSVADAKKRASWEPLGKRGRRGRQTEEAVRSPSKEHTRRWLTLIRLVVAVVKERRSAHSSPHGCEEAQP